MSDYLMKMEDKLTRLQMSLERVNCIVNDLTEYFNDYDEEKNEDKLFIIHDYNRHRIKADIVESLVCDALQEVDAATLIWRKQVNEEKKATTQSGNSEAVANE